MTLDEAIKVLNKYNYEEVTMYEPEWDAINTLVRLAEWYREQDLIRREDARELFSCYGIHDCLGYDCLEFLQPVGRKRIKPEKLKYCEDCCNFNDFDNRLGFIPRAEPPKENE